MLCTTGSRGLGMPAALPWDVRATACELMLKVPGL